MRMGVQQLKDFLDAPPAQPESASYSFVEEPYAAYLQAVAPTSQELALQRDNPPLALPRFILLFQGDWTPADRERTMASLKAQSYDRFQTATLPETGDGDYFLYLWPGDTLAPDALYHFARAAAGGADLIYGDEDHLAPRPPCCRVPFLKSAPSLITQWSFDMLSCGVAVHRNLLKQVGPMAGASAEARYAFNLKALAASRRAVHIPRPLYTLFQDRRPGPSAVALLETALGGQERVACGQWPGSFRVWAPVGNKPSFSIVIPNRNNCAGLRRLLESLEAYTVLPPCAIRIVDLGSRDATTLRYYQLLKKNRAAQILFPGEGNLSRGLNLAARSTSADTLVFLSPGVEILSPGWVDRLLEQLGRPGVGAAGGKLVDEAGKLLFTGGVVGIEGWTGSFYAGQGDDTDRLRKNRLVNSIRAVSYLSLACLAIPARVFWNVGGFDESFSQAGLDVELCLRLGRRGLACVYTPYTVLRHHGPLPSLAQAGQGDQRRAYDGLRDTLLWGDPHISPNYDLSAPLPIVSPTPYPPIRRNPFFQP